MGSHIGVASCKTQLHCGSGPWPALPSSKDSQQKAVSLLPFADWDMAVTASHFCCLGCGSWLVSKSGLALLHCTALLILRKFTTNHKWISYLNQNFKDSQKYKSLNWTCNVIVGDRAQSSDSNPVWANNPHLKKWMSLSQVWNHYNIVLFLQKFSSNFAF